MIPPFSLLDDAPLSTAPLSSAPRFTLGDAELLRAGLLGPGPQLPPIMMPPSAQPPMPAPQAAPLPQQQGVTLPQSQSFLDKVRGALSSIGQHASNSLVGPTPAGYEGLLSPDEIQSQRPSAWHAFMHAPDELGGQQEWQHNLDSLVQRRLNTAALAQQQGMLAKRAQLQKSLGPAPTDPAGFEAWVRKAYAAYASIGDMESLQHLNAVMQQITSREAKPAPIAPHIDLGDRIGILDPTGTKVISTIPKGIPPKTQAEVSADMKFQADQGNKILDDYARDTKDFHQVMAGWDVLVGATKDPSLATPFAITDAYARITNPGGIVRPTTMEMIDNMGSVGQRMRKYWEHNANGALPPDIMQDFKRTLYNIVSEHKKQYDQIRGKAIERGRRAKVDIAPLLEDYELVDPTKPVVAPPAGTTTSPRQQYSPGNPFVRQP